MTDANGQCIGGQCENLQIVRESNCSKGKWIWQSQFALRIKEMGAVMVSQEVTVVLTSINWTASASL